MGGGWRETHSRPRGHSQVQKSPLGEGSGHLLEFTYSLELGQGPALVWRLGVSWRLHVAFNFHMAMMEFSSCSWMKHRCIMGRWAYRIDRKGGGVTWQHCTKTVKIKSSIPT